MQEIAVLVKDQIHIVIQLDFVLVSLFRDFNDEVVRELLQHIGGNSGRDNACGDGQCVAIHIFSFPFAAKLNLGAIGQHHFIVAIFKFNRKDLNPREILR